MKIKKFLAVLLVTIIAVSVFSGCDVITKNDERDYNQVLATVTYEGMTSTVTKGEFESSFNSLAYYYVYYYGYTVEKAANYIFESLAQRKLLILYVRDYYADEQGVANSVNVDSFLTAVEKNEAVKSANSTMQSSYDSTFEELWKEYMAVNEKEYYTKYPDLAPDGYFDDDEDEEEEDNTDKKTDTPRAARPDKAEEVVDYDGELADEDVAVPFFDQDDHYEDEYTDEQKVVSDKAVAELKKSLKENYISYEYYLHSAHETQLLSKYQRHFGVGYTMEEYADLISSKYNDYVQVNKDTFKYNSESAYKTALGTLTNLVYHPESEQGYGYVFNILLKFSDEQTAKLKAFTAESTEDEAIAAYREMLAKQIKVNVTNPDYDPDYKDCEECCDDDDILCDDPTCPCKMYTREGVLATDILAEIEGIFANIDNGDLTAANAALTGVNIDLTLADIDGADGLSDYEKFVLKREVATTYIYLVNDDSGMYDTDKDNAISNSGLGYLITPEGKDSDYVQEFTDLGRNLVEGGLGEYGYCTTDYGYHLMFVSYVPYGSTFNSAGAAVEGVNEATDCIDLDYIVHYGRYDDENDKDQTLKQAIFDAMKDTYTNNLYNIEAQTLINQNKNDKITANDKLWKKLLKEYNKEYGGK